MSSALVKKPSALFPMAMSTAALIMVLAHVVLYGAAREVDEGTPAHIFQLLMAGQLPVMAFFTIKWLPRSPREALLVLAAQAGAALAAMSSVFFFNL
jgi:hypothetical protein